MARPSGLASDQHATGPGDAPRRKKASKSHPEVTQGSKRAASPTSEPSSPPAPKRKRLQSDDHDQLFREMEESAGRAQSQVSEEVSVQKTARRHVRRASEPVVAFADNEEEDEDDTQMTPTASTQPLPGLTPHLQRIGAPRGRPSNATRRARKSMPAQFRLEPVDEANGSQIQFAPFKATIDSRTRRRLKRNHLADEWNDLEDHQKEEKKLRRSYIELKRQLDQKNRQIADLEYQLEARRLGEINLTEDEAEDLRDQLTQAKQQIEDMRASSVYRGDSRETSEFGGYDGAMDFDDYDDDEPFLAIDPNDPDGPDPEEVEPLPNGPYAERVSTISSQVTHETLHTISQTSLDLLAEESSVPDKISDKAIKRYEAEIARLVDLVAEAQGSLRLVTLELQNASVMEPGASAATIVVELRHVFEGIREEMENLIPNCTDGLNNGQFIRKIPTLFEGLLTELQEKTVLAEKYHKESRLMRAQFENSIGLLERSDTRNDKLESQIIELQQNTEELRTKVSDLEERVATLNVLVDQQETELKEKDTRIHGLQDEVGDKDTAITRLRDSLEKYRTDLDNVTETATRTEEQLQETIAALKETHAADVLMFQSQFQDENELRLQAQGEAEQKSEYIDELEEQVERVAKELDALTTDLNQLRNRLATEQQDHANTKAGLEDEQDRVYAQQNQIENLEEQLQQLETELADTRASLDAERTQLEQTQASLDEANTIIADLQERVRNDGMEAQGLRSKLFQSQVEREEIIKNMETEAHERETGLQNDLDTETDARRNAELTIAGLETQIAQLQDDLASREDEIARLTKELSDTEEARDEHIAALNGQLTDLKSKYAALENTSNSTITTLQANITDLNNEVNALRIEVERITSEATQTENELREVLAQKEDELAAKEQTIVEKEERFAQLQTKYDDLDDKHNYAISQFADEQFSFNKLQEKFARGQKTMEEKIKSLEAHIREMQTVAAQTATDHEIVVQEKEEEIRDLQTTLDNRSEIIAELHADIELLKNTFAKQKEDTDRTIDQLLDSQRLLQEQNENMAADLKKRNADALDAAKAMKVKGLVVKTQKADLNKVVHGKISKTSERVKVGKKGRKPVLKERKWRDSGFGAGEDSDIENEEFDHGEEEGIVG